MNTPLNEQQLFSIEKILEEKGLRYGPLKEELLDHICCQVERAMGEGLLFSQALQRSLDTFQKDEMKELQTQTLSLLNQNQTFMKRLSIAALITFLFLASATWLSSQDPPTISPLKGDTKITSGFGMRMHPIQKVKKQHQGVDFSAPTGTPVYATSDGKVVKAEMSKGEGYGYGQHIVIQHDEHFNTLYAQLSRMDVKVGDTVKRGDAIGAVGSSGMSTAPHLHYEVIKDGEHVDPEGYLRP